jgi:hypothetical protein
MIRIMDWKWLYTVMEPRKTNSPSAADSRWHGQETPGLYEFQIFIRVFRSSVTILKQRSHDWWIWQKRQ